MKIWNYIVIFLTMMMVMEFCGLHTGISGTLEIFGISINSETSNLETGDIQNSRFYSKIFGEDTGVIITLLATGVGIIVGLFSKSYDPSLILLPVILFVGGLFASTGLSLISYISEDEVWMRALIGTIFLPLIAGYIWSCVEFFRGVD